MAKKTFFAERNVKEIGNLNSSEAYTQRGLVDRIENLNPAKDSLIIRAQIVPGNFYRGVSNAAEASRRAYKHGNLVTLPHPPSREGCYNCSEIPLAMRARTFSELEGMREEEINYIGYSFQPGWGDRIKRVVPFVWVPEAVRLFAYAENNTPDGIKVDTRYIDSAKVKTEGASIPVEVPSRTKKNPRYKFKLLHVPIIRGRENLATVLNMKPALQFDTETGEQRSGRTIHDDYNIRYTAQGRNEASNRIMFYPQDIAAYLGIIKDRLKEHNLTPMEMNPFALPSKHQAEFFMKLCNNVLMYDPTIKAKNKLRKPHLAEKSILLARALGQFGHDDFAFWNPTRDGLLKDYDWSIKGGK